MERKIEVEVSLEGLRIQENPMFCQGDRNTHFINIKFMEDVELDGYTLQVFYLPPFPSITPFVDLFTNVTKDFTFPIPNKALERNGKVKVEFSLSKDNKLVTVNKTFDFEVTKTINGTSLTAYPEGELKFTIAQQIEKIKLLLAQSQEKIDEYNQNVVEKTTAFNNNSAERLEAYNQNANEKLGAYNNNDTSKTTAFNENAERKTEEFDTHVKDTVDKTYLEMDKKATEYANAAGERANEAVIEQGDIVLRAILKEGNTQAGIVVESGTKAIENIDNSKNIVIQEVTDEGAKQRKIVEIEGGKQVGLVTDAGTEEISKIQATGEKAVGDVNANKTANIQAVTDEGNLQKQNLIKQEELSKQAVIAEGTKQTTAVTNKGTEEIGKVASEGSKQTGLVNIEGNKVIEQVKNIVAGNPATTNALTLSGKTRAEFEKELQGVAGGYSGTFPLTSAVQNGIYLLPATGKFYVCTQAYNGTSLSAPNSNFEELSVFKNRDRLDNLYTFYGNKTMYQIEKWLPSGTTAVGVLYVSNEYALLHFHVSINSSNLKIENLIPKEFCPKEPVKIRALMILNEPNKYSVHEGTLNPDRSIIFNGGSSQGRHEVIALYSYR